jgi:hypothetical protein
MSTRIPTGRFKFVDRKEIKGTGTNPMKTEEHPETAAVFPQTIIAAVSELKERLQQDYERTYPRLGEIIRIVLDEEEKTAWKLSSFPHLLLPDLVEEHIATLGLEPADTRHDDIWAPSIDMPYAVAAMC